MLRNLGDLDFYLSMSLKLKCDSVIGLPICGFLVVSNSNIWPNTAPLRDTGISIQSLSDLDIELSRSPRSNVIAPMDSPYMLSY